VKQGREDAAFNIRVSKLTAQFWQWKVGLCVVRQCGQPDAGKIVWQCCAVCFDAVVSQDPAFLRSSCSDVPRAEVIAAVAACCAAFATATGTMEGRRTTTK
jgi:hypothetical protein